MSKRLAYVLAGGLLGALLPLQVQAFPASPLPTQAAASDVMPAGGVCRYGFHRGPSGHCVRRAPSLYPPPAYAPIEPVAPLACPDGGFHLFPYRGCFAPTCPYGYYLGRDGQCFPIWRPDV